MFGLGTGFSQAVSGAQFGKRLFLALNGAVYYVIWVGVPLLTADAISREKREGTLGLLFLTPLNAWDVVGGKGLILGFRALGLLMAGMPVLILPFVMGGVSWTNAIFMGMCHLFSLVLALAVGLAVSALSQRPVRALIGGLCGSLLLSFSLNALLAILFGGDLLSTFFGPKALGETMEWIERAAPREVRLWIGALAVVPGLVAPVLLHQVVRQVDAFWQDAPLTTGRTRSAVGRWFRAFVRLAVVLALLVAGAFLIENPARGNFIVLGLLSGVVCLLAWGGGIVWAIRSGAEEAERELARHGWRKTMASSGKPLRGWWELNSAASWALTWITVGAQVIFLGLAVWLGLVPGRIGLAMVLNPLSALVLSVSVGNLAWAWGRTWVRAVFRAVLLGVPAFIAWCFAFSILIGHVLISCGEFESWSWFLDEGVHIVLMVGSMVASGVVLMFAEEAFRSASPHLWLLDTVLLVVLVSVVSLVLWLWARWLESRRGRVVLADDPGLSVSMDLGDPVLARGFFRRHKRRLLDKNPMRWLLERSRLSRLSRTGWLAFTAVAEVVMVSQVRTLTIEETWIWQAGILFLLSIGLSIAASLSFQEEKRTGAMELILVTPLSVAQIIGGRWRGLVGQFVPSLALLVLVGGAAALVGGGDNRRETPDLLAGLAVGISAFVSAPFVGMLCSLRFRNAMVSCLATALMPVATVAFMAMTRLGLLYVWDNSPWVMFALCAVVLLGNLVLAVSALVSLAGVLRKREAAL